MALAKWAAAWLRRSPAGPSPLCGIKQCVQVSSCSQLSVAVPGVREWTSPPLVMPAGSPGPSTAADMYGRRLVRHHWFAYSH
jgi:hypothetical protein